MSLTHKPITGFLYVLPALLFTAAFVVFPFVNLVGISFTDLSLMGGGKFVGFANYSKAFGDKAFWAAMRFTLLYTAILTPLLMIISFALALLTVDNRFLPRLTRTVIFLPVVIGLGSSSQLWYWLFDQQVGLINKMLLDLHIIAKPFILSSSAVTGFWAITISVTWKVIGFGMILYIGALQSISSEITQAAMIDGATYLQRVRLIMIPLSYRTLLLSALISAIGSMLAFDQFYIMTGGGPRGQTFTAVYLIYQNSFVYFKLGYGAAMSLILALIILAGASLQIWLSNRKQVI